MTIGPGAEVGATGTGATGGAGSGTGTGGQGATGGAPSGGTGAQTSWRDSLPDDLKSNATLALIQDIPSLAKGYVHAQAQIGKKGVILPTEKSTDEEWASFYKQVGQPELEKFNVEAPKDKKIQDAFLAKFKETAHKAGLLPKQAQGLLDWFSGFESEQLGVKKTQQDAAVKENLGNLRKEWGDAYDKKIDGANVVVTELGSPTLAQKLVSSGINNDPDFIKFLDKVAPFLGEDKLRGQGGGSGGQTPGEIQVEINKIMGNKQHPYFNGNHPQHKDAVKEMETLQKRMWQAGQPAQRGA